MACTLSVPGISEIGADLEIREMNDHSSLRARWFRSLYDPAFPAAEYEALVDRHESSTPYNRLAWLRGAELSAGRNEVETLTVWRESRLLACIPVIWERRGPIWSPGLRIARHLGAPLADRIGLMVEDNDPALVTATLRMIQHRRPVAWIELNELYDGGCGPELMNRFAREHCVDVHEHRTCRVPVFRLPAEHPQEKSLPERVRAKLRRERRRSTEAGASIHRMAPSDEGAWLDRIITVERASWKGTDGVGIFSGAERERWMRASLGGLAGSGRIRIAALKLDGQVISYRLGLLEKGRLYDYNSAFLPEHSKIASGRLLLDELIHWGIDEGWHAVDASRVSRVSGHHLHERMNESVQQYRVRYFSKRPGGLLASTAQTLWERYKPAWRRIRNRLRKTRGSAAAGPQANPDAQV